MCCKNVTNSPVIHEGKVWRVKYTMLKIVTSKVMLQFLDFFIV